MPFHCHSRYLLWTELAAVWIDFISAALRHSNRPVSLVQPSLEKTAFRFSSAWKSHKRSDEPSPLWPIAPYINPSLDLGWKNQIFQIFIRNFEPWLYGVITCAPTERPPAEQPKIVILDGSPPKSAIFWWTHLIAICWSRTPKFPRWSLSIPDRKPTVPSLKYRLKSRDFGVLLLNECFLEIEIKILLRKFLNRSGSSCWPQ